jgi:hypothetical protein
MTNIQFNSTQNTEKHECEAHHIGDWIVYTCPQCDYELKKNWKTGELFVENVKAKISHFGSYAPPQYKRPHAASLN